MNEHNNRVKISIIEKIIILIVFSIIPLHFIIMKFSSVDYLWEKVYLFNIVSISYSIIFIILIFFQFIIKKPYLALVFGCHQKHDRSYKLFSQYLKICTRCSGILIGILIMPFITKFKINYNYFLLGFVPILIDGLLQYFSKYKSTNIRRLLTGILFGPSLIILSSYYYYFIAILLMKFINIIL